MKNIELKAKFAHLGLHREVKEMPEQKAHLNFEMEFTAEEFEIISRGYFAHSMDEKWDFVFENGWFYAFRSWTGNCIYQTRIEPHEGSYRTTETWVNRDPKQYNFTSDAQDLTWLEWRINRLLLDKDVPFPPRTN